MTDVSNPLLPNSYRTGFTFVRLTRESSIFQCNKRLGADEFAHKEVISNSLMEEQTADHRVGSGRKRDLEGNVPRQVPHQVFAVLEA
jgi:hypothetical protein